MKRKDLISIGIVGILILGLGIGLVLVRQSQEIREKAQAVTDVAVSLVPASYSLTSGQATSLSIILTNVSSPAKDISINTAQVDLQFDASSFSVSNLSCNTSFLSSVAASSVSDNKISLTCFAPGGSGTKTLAAGTQNVLGSFSITASDKTGTSQITFLDALVPDTATQTDVSGGTGTGGSYTIIAEGGTENTATPAPTAGAPNSCGGTCGSNYNCQSGLFCYQGFCRNPSCPSSTSCACPTATPTPKPTVKGTPRSTPTPTLTASPIAEITPLPSPSPSPIETETPIPQEKAGITSNLFLIGGIAAIVISLLAALLLLFKRRGPDNPPQITPPTTMPPVPPQQTPPVGGTF